MSSAGRDMFMGAAAIALIVLGGWLHHVIGTPRHDAYRQTAIANAVSEALETRPDLTCKEQSIIDGIKALAENGVHMTGFSLEIKVDNREVGK